jgi:hypothetical protein
MVKKFFGTLVAGVTSITANLTIAGVIGALRRIPPYLRGQLRRARHRR